MSLSLLQIVNAFIPHSTGCVVTVSGNYICVNQPMRSMPCRAGYRGRVEANYEEYMCCFRPRIYDVHSVLQVLGVRCRLIGATIEIE